MKKLDLDFWVLNALILEKWRVERAPFLARRGIMVFVDAYLIKLKNITLSWYPVFSRSFLNSLGEGLKGYAIALYVLGNPGQRRGFMDQGEGETSRKPVIALLTDFGISDGYVGAMKGVILGIAPRVSFVDIAHGISRQDVWEGAYVLASVAPYFPRGTIFLCVVDPGVGTERKIILMETGAGHYFVGPDNGLLSLIGAREGVERLVEVANPQYMLEEISQTFQGRDVMAPAAAYLAKGVNPSEFGPELTEYVRFEFNEPTVKDDVIRGEVIHVDGFGNLITNMSEDLLRRLGVSEGSQLKLSMGSFDGPIDFCKAYADVDVGSLLAIVGSAGLLEISVNRGSAARRLKSKAGMRVEIRKPRGNVKKGCGVNP